MAIDWNPYGLAYVPVALFSVAGAALIYFHNASSTQNRRLGMLLFATGSLCAGIATGYLSTDPGVAYGGYSIVFSSWLMVQVATVRLAAALPTPLLGFLRNKWVDRGLLAVYFASTILWLLAFQARTFNEVSPFAPFLPWRPVYPAGALETWSAFGILASLVLAVASVDAFRRSEIGTVTRRRLRTYMITALAGEVLAVAGYLLRLHIVEVVRSGVAPPRWELQFFLYSTAITYVVYLLGLGYAILKDQIFDIDLRIKRGAGRSMAGAAIAAAFFVVSELTEAFLPVGGLLPGLVAAGLLTLAFTPMQRAAMRLLDRVTPQVRDTPDYVGARKRDVYKAALEELLVGGLSAKEREALDVLRAKLGVDSVTAAKLERGTRAWKHAMS